MKLPFISDKKQGSGQSQEVDTEAVNPQGPLCPELQGEDFDENIPGLSDLYAPEQSAETVDDAVVDDIAAALLDDGKLSYEQYEQLQKKMAAKAGSDSASILLESGAVNAEDILMARAKLQGLEFWDIKPGDVDKKAFAKLDIDFVRSNDVMPVAIEEGVFVVATSEPENVLAIEDIKRQVQSDIQVVVCNKGDIEAVCNLFEEQGDEYSVDEIINDMTEIEIVQDEDKDSTEDLERMAEESPVIKFVNYLISNAISEGASDIHIEPKDKFTKVRYRIDGVLFEIKQSPIKMHPAVVSRVKIMANLDISETRLPQDGKISVIVGGRAIDLRVSTLPTSKGEKVVIRVLDSKSIIRGLEQLGMEPAICESFREQIAMPHGILLVTGPTGSGKSTTLYSALCQMDGKKLNISTVEDPVEYQLDFCTQVQVSEKIGLDFASSLRSLLRQDPDIMMIGEIRDNETARIAVQAALTGHLVLSTLHTNDAASSITRLADIGIDSYLIAASLNAVLAQRLVRKICPKCKKSYKAPKNISKYLEGAGVKATGLFHGAGCEACRGSGYVGRVGIYELLVVDDKFRDMINKDSSVSNMRQSFHKSKHMSLFDDGINKVKQGLTTIEEVLRVTEVYGQNENEVFVENIE